MSSTVQRCSSSETNKYSLGALNCHLNHLDLNATAVTSDMRPVNVAARLANLIAEHDDLDQAVASMLCASGRDDLVISRLKKRKLLVKDEISRAEAYLHGLAEGLA